MTTIDQPARLTIGTDGALDGRSGRYQKRLGDLLGVYADSEAHAAAVAEQGADSLVYSVEEQRYQSGPGALVVGTSTLLPGRVGDEFALTRGHLHAVADRAELYHCLSGHGVILLETAEGHSEAVDLRPGQSVNVPGHWIHRSINVGPDPFVTLFCYNADAGQDYEIIAAAGGMKTLVVDDGEGGWTTRTNPHHTHYAGGAA